MLLRCFDRQQAQPSDGCGQFAASVTHRLGVLRPGALELDASESPDRERAETLHLWRDGGEERSGGRQQL